MTSTPGNPAAAPHAESDADAPFCLVDGHSLTFKAYYGVRGRLVSPEGTPTGAVYGFLRMLLKLIEDRKPRYLAVIFDTGQPTFREALFPAYKANREAAPEDFGTQMGLILETLRALGITVYSLGGYEADDLIATIAHAEDQAGRNACVFTADKDLFQLVNDRTTVLRFGQQDLETYDAAAVERRTGVRPDQIPDWLALVGDSSDNIPGVPGIGEKTAAILLQKFGSLEAMIERAGEIEKEKQRLALVNGAEQARLSRRLATVARDVPFEWSRDACLLPENLFSDEAIRLFVRLGFESILKERKLEAPKQAEVIELEAASASNYRSIEDLDSLRAWVAEARNAEWLALDTETTGLDPMLADLVGISLSTAPNTGIYIPVGHIYAERNLRAADLVPILDPLWKDDGAATGRRPKLAAHNARFDWKALRRAGFSPRAADFDTSIASFALDPGREAGHGLKALATELCRMPMRPISELIGSGKKSISMAELPPSEVYEYAARDADATMRLTLLLGERLAAIPSLRKLFETVEMPLLPVLDRMETGGFAVDLEELKRLAGTMQKEITRIGKATWEAAGRTFNIDSPKQVAELLFEELKLPPGRKTKTGLSTDSDVLDELKKLHPVAGLILEYREVTKLKGTYADALPKQINPETRRIHSSFSPTVAVTGRLSSHDPNLQNIPIRTEMGREIRRAFVPDRPGHKLLSADYSQIELRILAHFCKDEALRRAYAENRDIHALTASRVFHVAESEVTSEMRGKAKVINFGIIYGMSAHGLAQRLDIPRADAQRFITAYFAGYPGVKRWMDGLLAKARIDGYVETMAGRRRALPDLNAANKMLRSVAERIAVNTPIQGTSADMIKLAMIAIDRDLPSVHPKARMVCQVHDELVFSIPEEALGAAESLIRDRMEKALPLEVPVKVDVGVGANWAEC